MQRGAFIQIYIIMLQQCTAYPVLFLFVNKSVCLLQPMLHVATAVYCSTAKQEIKATSIYLKFDRFFPSKIDNKKAFLSSNFAMLCAPKRTSLLIPSAPSRGSSAGVFRDRSISMWLSLIHWAKKNCLANYEKQKNKISSVNFEEVKLG